jgi:DNA-binding transcriptional LysR family regulator
MDIDLLTLRLFVAVAEELNMTRAARSVKDADIKIE